MVPPSKKPLHTKESPIAAKIEGNVTGLKSSEVKAVTNLGKRKYNDKRGYTNDQAHELCAVSRLINRQVGLIIDRTGVVLMVIVGTASGLFIPELPRERISSGKLRGLRLLHTHLEVTGLTQEDLMDMLFLRLDCIQLFTVNPYGNPVQMHYAHLLPQSDGQNKGEENKGYKVYTPETWDHFDVDILAQAESLEAEIERNTKDSIKADEKHKERAILISVSTAPKDVQEQYLDELEELARTAGIKVVGRLMQRVSKINPRSVLGEGKLAELEVLALQGQAGVLIFDNDLAPAQLQNIAETTERKVLDRTQVILDIFAQHAKTKAGKLQVEMAQLKYTLPRLVGRKQAMDRLMGGIGGRGPGETKLETDRRRVRDRITKIKQELDQLRKQRQQVRARRTKSNLPIVCFVGYTNVGKSTLLNALTGSDVLAENKLFATLDPTTRRLRFPKEHELVLADTVGFIRNLPKDLQEAFRATLEELEEADFLLHVADASHTQVEVQIQAVERQLEEMELNEKACLLILNKWESIDEERKADLELAFPHALHTSALQKEGLEELSALLEKRFFEE